MPPTGPDTVARSRDGAAGATLAVGVLTLRFFAWWLAGFTTAVQADGAPEAKASPPCGTSARAARAAVTFLGVHKRARIAL
jgi:hypothetical protein